MQDEIDALGPSIEVDILGVNAVGSESGNGSITNNRDLPWLQDTTAESVWADWAVTYRDVIILDTDNTPYAVYNLTEHDLGVPANYEALKSMLIEAAGGTF